MQVLLLGSACMFKAMLLLQIFMLCYYLHLLLMNIMLYVTHTPYYFVSLLTQITDLKNSLIPHVT